MTKIPLRLQGRGSVYGQPEYPQFWSFHKDAWRKIPTGQRQGSYILVSRILQCDGVTEKTLTHASDEMATQENFNNDVNGGGTLGEASSSGSEFVGDGQTLGRYQATRSQKSNQRRRWTKADNIRAIKSFYKSNPNAIGYRQRMHGIWFEDGGFEITEQNLADQVRRI